MRSPSYTSIFRTWQTLTLAGALTLQLFAFPSDAQSSKRRRVAKPRASAPVTAGDPVERAVAFVCQDRTRDAQGTVPIDVMAAQTTLPITDSRVIEGRNRAQSMLPTAKRLIPFALSRVAANNRLEPLSLKWIIERVRSINVIKAEPGQRDNAVWRPSEPDTIIFGTVFLAGLRSNEAMIAVLAHEITHAINGTDNALQPVFKRVGDKSSTFGKPIAFAAAVEIACELVALEVARDYVSQSSSRGLQRRRLARPLQKGCVTRDLSDPDHLSPRETMRLLVMLEPKLALGSELIHSPKALKSKPIKRSKRKKS